MFPLIDRKSLIDANDPSGEAPAVAARGEVEFRDVQVRAWARVCLCGRVFVCVITMPAGGPKEEDQNACRGPRARTACLCLSRTCLFRRALLCVCVCMCVCV